jgi:hypothetical protein
MPDSRKITKRGLILIAIAALIVSAVGLGVAQGGGGTLTKKSAKKTYLSKKTANKQFLKTDAANSTFQTIQRELQVPAATAQPEAPNAIYDDTNGTAAGAQHTDAGLSVIGWSWILPPYYPAGTQLNVQIYYAIGQTGCSFDLRPNALSINKIGSNNAGVGQGDIGGLQGIFAAPPGSQVSSVTWTIPGTVAGIQLAPGTSITMGTFRNPGLVGDTCVSPLVMKGNIVSW